jgi:hypothetical protein
LLDRVEVSQAERAGAGKRDFEWGSHESFLGQILWTVISDRVDRGGRPRLLGDDRRFRATT